MAPHPSARFGTPSPRSIVALAATAGLVGSLALLGGSAALAVPASTVDVTGSEISATRSADAGWFYDNDGGTGAFAVTKDGPGNEAAMKLSLIKTGGAAGTDKIYLYNSLDPANRLTDIPALLDGASYSYAGVNVNFQIEVIFKPTDVAHYGPAGSTAACTSAATWYGWGLTSDTDWCYTVLKWEPFASSSTWVDVDLDQDVAASATNGTGGWIAQKRVGSIAPPGTFNGQKISDILAQMADYQVTGFVFGAGGGTPGPAYGWVKSYTIGGITYQFAPEPAAAAAPPATDSTDLEGYIATNSVDVPGSTANFTPTGTSNTDLDKIDPTKPLNGTYDNWQDPTDSFVDVYSYSTAKLVGTFPVIGSKVFLANVDLSSLAAGKHYLLLQGQTSGTIGIVQFNVLALAATGSETALALGLAATSLLALGLWLVLSTVYARRHEAW